MALVSLFYLLLLLNSISHTTQATKPSAEEAANRDSSLQTYIVHVRKPVDTTLAESTDKEAYYRSYLPTGSASFEEDKEEEEDDRMIYSYDHVISGFAARLTEEEVSGMAKKDGFVQAHPERIFHPQTTHTPKFLGLQQGLGFWNQSNFGRGVIVGVLDTGINPDHPSFADMGMPPPPSKWKGKCEFGNLKCNNKLIGARVFSLAAKKKGIASSPIDEDGHGTHTSSTAAGNFVENADVLGNAKGTAAGMAPHAHLAMYKVCSPEDCAGSDILAALDAAVHDGVDVISISLGGQAGIPLFSDTIAIGTYAAMQKGIFVSCAAGNAGPFKSTISNEAPWYLTVGASTIDRNIVATAKLGNGEELDGQSLYRPSKLEGTLLPIVDAANNRKPNSTFCGEGALDGMDVKGKVVICEKGGGVTRFSKGKEVKASGGAAMILVNGEADGFTTIADPHVLPSTYVSFAAGQKIKAYLKATKNPTAALLFKGTVIGNSAAPAVAAFSSRGPTLEAKGILKPDIIGPGVSILAAWPFPLENNTNTKSTFMIESGTSMACPHLSGIAALLKSSHPSWSPAVIKSAMMTTADLLNVEGKQIVDQNLRPANFFAIGSGHVNPARANDPGLVYDIQPEDYEPFLCGLGYTDDQVAIIAHKHVNCSKQATKTAEQLNYPSFSLTLGTRPQTFSRTVTNVGEANSSYDVTILHQVGVDVIVSPSHLKFSKIGEKATYTVTFSRGGGSSIPGGFAEGFIKWVSDKHFVRSPVSVMFN
ncbi:Subtilisin-like protease 4 [Linum grandiflorum]